MIQEFTLEFWIRADNSRDEAEGIINCFEITGSTTCDLEGYGFYRVNDTLGFLLGGTDICEDNALEMTLDQGVWTHVAVSISTSMATLYKDGALVASKMKNTSIAYPSGGEFVPLRIGRGPNTGSAYLIYIYNLHKVYDRTNG